MKHAEMGSLAALLQELKDRTPYSYNALAKRLRMSPSTLHRYCNGTTLPADYAPIEGFARLCKATPAELAELHRRWARANALRATSAPAAPVTGDAETDSRRTVPLADRPDGAVPPGSPGPGASLRIRRNAPWDRRTRRTVVLSGLALVAGAIPTGIWLADSTRVPEPVAAWPLDERPGAQIAKDAAGSYEGTATAVRWGEGSDGAARFDGRGSRVTTAGPVLKTGPGHSYTVSAWAWLDVTVTPALDFVTVVSQSAGNLTAFYLQYWRNPNRWAFSGPSTNAEFRVPSSVKAVPSLWTHLVGVHDRHMWTLYVDGKQAGSAEGEDVSASESIADQLIIGGARDHGHTYRDHFPGSIKNVQVFDQALTLDEIKALGRPR
ncbi:LamG-like jellyroll fold domain-containing protein [Spongiactinospora sp. 9N601]|uniref:LamG-like jellyroll fold domain-containing protein n=1 Tax=Spongiactinospora sp. 9N601 TaxID=3375149 RepID=UPI0037927278